MAIIHLVQLLPTESSDLPGGRDGYWLTFTLSGELTNRLGRAALLTPPYLVLHREEFAWPDVLPHPPVRSYIKPFRAAPFHPSPSIRDPETELSDYLRSQM